MATSFIDEYLVKLGSTVDQSGMRRFQQALREASAVADSSAASIAGSFFKAQTEITAGFLAIGSAAVGLVDKVAMADQSYRLFALHMYMSKDAARSLKVAMDALGEPLENLTWDKELRDRTHQLIEDQRAMSPDGDFEAQMRKVRDIRFEFTRMEVEGQYLAMHVVEDFMKALGYGPDELLKKLQDFNAWVTHNLPEISATLVNEFMPVWRDMRDIGSAIGEGVYDAAGAFQTLVGVLSGDDSIQTDTVTLESMATALGHVANGAADAAKFMLALEEDALRLAKAMLYATYGVKDWIAKDAPGAKEREKKWFGRAGAELWGGESPFDTGSTFFDSPSAAQKGFDPHFSDPTKMAYTNRAVHRLIDRYAEEMGVDPALAHAVAQHESGERQYDKNGNPMKNPSSSATGVYQLVSGTARFLGVDPSNTEQNVFGGVKLLLQMLTRYHGNVAEAVGAYGEGAGTMDAVLAGRATLRPEARSNIASVLHGMGRHGDVQVGSIVIHIDKKNATNEDVGNVAASKIRDLRNKQVQRNLAEFQDPSWGY